MVERAIGKRYAYIAEFMSGCQLEAVFYSPSKIEANCEAISWVAETPDVKFIVEMSTMDEYFK